MAYLRFDFNKQPLEFSQPLEVISCHQLSKVKTCLQKAEAALSQGFYIAGFLSYEASYALAAGLSPEFLAQQQSQLAQQKKTLPLIWLGVFTAPKKAVNKTLQNFQVSEWQLTANQTAYTKKFNQLFSLLESTQLNSNSLKNNQLTSANLTQQLTASFSGCPLSYYRYLCLAQQANYSAFWQAENQAIVSVSPELFFQQQDNSISVKPMKGTSPRGRSSQEDLQLAQELKTSAKNQLENRLAVEAMQQELAPLLITSQAKNQAANPSPKINWFELASYPSLWQMTSSFTAQLKPEITPIEVLRQLFPCTSIAGTPKAAAIEALAAVEGQSRGIYCGSLGYITPNKEAVFNVAIRTLSLDLAAGTASYGAGGALTNQAKAEEEFAELLTKTQVLRLQPYNFSLLETLRLEAGQLVLLKEHLERLSASARYFNYPLNLTLLEQQLQLLAEKLAKGSWRVRLTLASNGRFNLSCTALSPVKPTEGFYWPSWLKCASPLSASPLTTSPTPSPLKKALPEPVKIRCQIAKTPIDSSNFLHFHKTTARDIYTRHQPSSSKTDVFDTLLFSVNEKGQQQATEFTMGNLVVEIDQQLYTPPVESGLLAGTLRSYLLNQGAIKEKPLSLEEVTTAKKAWFINGLRGWLEVELVN